MSIVRVQLPNKGQKCFIRVGSRTINGKCLSNECRSSHGPNKGEVIPGLGTLIDNDGNKFWITPNNWEFGHA